MHEWLSQTLVHGNNNEMRLRHEEEDNSPRGNISNSINFLYLQNNLSLLINIGFNVYYSHPGDSVRVLNVMPGTHYAFVDSALLSLHSAKLDDWTTNDLMA